MEPGPKRHSCSMLACNYTVVPPTMGDIGSPKAPAMIKSYGAVECRTQLRYLSYLKAGDSLQFRKVGPGGSVPQGAQLVLIDDGLPIRSYLTRHPKAILKNCRAVLAEPPYVEEEGVHVGANKPEHRVVRGLCARLCHAGLEAKLSPLWDDRAIQSQLDTVQASGPVAKQSGQAGERQFMQQQVPLPQPPPGVPGRAFAGDHSLGTFESAATSTGLDGRADAAGAAEPSRRVRARVAMGDAPGPLPSGCSDDEADAQAALATLERTFSHLKKKNKTELEAHLAKVQAHLAKVQAALAAAGTEEESQQQEKD